MTFLCKPSYKVAIFSYLFSDIKVY